MSVLKTPVVAIRYLTVGGTVENQEHVDGPVPADIAVAEDLIRIDMVTQTSVVDRTLAVQPVNPAVHDLYALPASPTGTDWSGNGNSIAGFYVDPLDVDPSTPTLFKWYFVPVWVGLRIYDRSANQECRWNGSSWTVTHP